MQDAHVVPSDVLNIITYLVAVDRSVATVGGVSIVLSSATILHCVPLTTLQSDKNKCKSKSLQQTEFVCICIICVR